MFSFLKLIILLLFFHIYFKLLFYPGSYSREERDMQEPEDLFLCDTECPFIFNMWDSIPWMEGYLLLRLQSHDKMPNSCC